MKGEKMLTGWFPPIRRTKIQVEMHSVKIGCFSVAELQQIQGQKSQFRDAMELIYEVFFGSPRLSARLFLSEIQHITEQ